MHDTTLVAFSDELQKIAAAKVREESAAMRSAKAYAGTMGANTGLFATVLALMKSKHQPQAEGEMASHVREMAGKMGIKGELDVNAPKGVLELSPSYDPSKVRVNTPVGIRDALIGHELGHARNFEVMRELGMDKGYNALQAASRIGSQLTLAPALFTSAGSKDPSYKPGIYHGLLAAPMVAEEAAASSRATAHLMREHGVAAGLWKSLPLLPAFGTYATIAAAPLAVTYLRKRKLERAAEKPLRGGEKEKVSAFLPGGTAARAHRRTSDFDPRQLALGTRKEMQEHGVPRAVAQSIAADHLTENPREYKD